MQLDSSTPDLGTRMPRGPVSAAESTPVLDFGPIGQPLAGPRARQVKALLAKALDADRKLKRALCALARILELEQDPAFGCTARAGGDTVPGLLREIRNGSPSLDEDVAQRLERDVARWVGEARTSTPAQPEFAASCGRRFRTAALTPKESRVLELLTRGYSNNAMAACLCLSESTVRTHLRSINCKLHARSRTQAIAIARDLGIA